MSSENNRSLLEGKKILNLGLRYPLLLPLGLDVKTVPIIQIHKHQFSSQELKEWHQKARGSDVWIFSSKTAVALFFASLPKDLSHTGKVITVGQATTMQLHEFGAFEILQAKESTQEGMLEIIDEVIPKGTTLFWPRSKQARPFLSHQLIKRGYILYEMPLYSSDSKITGHPVDLISFDVLLFTSPSTVDAYLEIYQKFLSEKTHLCIGPITYQKVLEGIKKSCAKALPKILMLGEIN